MLKKITLFLLIGLSIVGIYLTVRSLQQKTLKNSPLINCIPKDAAVILAVENPMKMWSSLSTTSVIWNDLKNISYFETLDEQLRNIDSIMQLDSVLMKSRAVEKTLISIHPSNKTPNILTVFASEESVFNALKEKYNSRKNKKGFYIIGKEKSNYMTYTFPFVIIASSQELLTKSINQLQKKESILQDDDFVKIRKTVNKGSNIHIYTNAINLKKMVLPFVKKNWIETWESNKKWTVYDVILKNEEIILNGLSLSKPNNKLAKYSDLTEANLLPPNIISVNEYTINGDSYGKILKQIDNDCNCNIKLQLERWIGNHLTEVTFGKGLRAVFIPTKTTENIIDDVAEIIKIDTTDYQLFGTKIYRVFSSSFAQLSGFPADEIYFYYHNSNLVFSSYKGLKQLMFYWQKTENRNTESFYSLFSKEMMAQKSTTSHYANLEYIKEKGLSILKPDFQNLFSKSIESLGNRMNLAYQTNAMSSIFLHQAIILKSNSKVQSNSNQMWEVFLENEISFGPKLVQNHKSKSLDIFIQDTTNTVYLLNAFGEVKWSKKLDGKIMANINQIDLFGNSKYQLVFNTPTKVYLLDINGNTISGFPIELPSLATAPVSAFDNQGGSEYRFLISCSDNVIYNFDKTGKITSDWTSPKSLDLISSSFKAIKLEDKNYFYSLDNSGKLYFLNTKGEEALKIDTTLNPKNNSLYIQERASFSSSSFIYVCDSTNSIKDYTFENNLVTYTLDSNKTNTTLVLLDLKHDSYLDYLSFYKNKIEVYGPDKTLANRNEYLFNVEKHYTLVNSIHNKDYIILEDEENRELTILNSNLTQLNRKPIIGDLNVDIGDLNANRKLNVICRKAPNSIVAYKLE